MPKEIAQGIVVDLEVMGGTPVITGTRIPVDSILDKLSAKHDLDELLDGYPELTMDQVQDCLRYAASIVQEKRRARKRMIPW